MTIKGETMESNELKELKQILTSMDIPKLRINDIPWLSRNLMVRNSKHPLFPKAQKLIKILLKKA
jgi:hypothetical protein